MKICGIGFEEKIQAKKEKTAKRAAFKEKVENNGGVNEYLKKIKNVDPELLEAIEFLLIQSGLD